MQSGLLLLKEKPVCVCAHTHWCAHSIAASTPLRSLHGDGYLSGSPKLAGRLVLGFQGATGPKAPGTMELEKALPGHRGRASALLTLPCVNGGHLWGPQQ